jgi:hypothetical protein
MGKARKRIPKDAELAKVWSAAIKQIQRNLKPRQISFLVDLVHANRRPTRLKMLYRMRKSSKTSGWPGLKVAMVALAVAA